MATDYTANLEYDCDFQPWPWFFTVYADGKVVTPLDCAMTRKGAIRKAKRLAYKHTKYMTRKTTEVVEL